jgi:REP element-mobilizing transposase RayT
MVEQAWKNISQYGSRIDLDEFIVMPNHIHGIVLIELDGLNPHCGQARRPAPTLTWDIEMVGAGFHPRPRSQSHSQSDSNSSRESESIFDVIQRFKSWTTYQYQAGIKRQGATPLHHRLWQRGYYEHTIWNDADLNRIREYIRDNPKNWNADPVNPA